MRTLPLLERPKLERPGILLVLRLVQGGLLSVEGVETASVSVRIPNKSP